MNVSIKSSVPTSKRTPQAILAGLCSLVVLAGCTMRTGKGNPYDSPTGKADHGGHCEYEVDFDKRDPNDYVWTVKVIEAATKKIIGGYAEAHFRRYPAGVDPEEGEPVQTGRIPTRGEPTNGKPLGGTLWSPATLAKDISYEDLVNGTFRFYTLRSSDKFAMTSCTREISFEDAVRSHNQLLPREEPPTFDPGNITDPHVYYNERVEGKPGVVMLVDSPQRSEQDKEPAASPCANEGGDGETRSVLSHLAVIIEAKPNPEAVRPHVHEGINFNLNEDEGNYCETSPHDWSWQVRAFNGQTKVGNARDLPGQHDVKLEVNNSEGSILEDGLTAINVQVDPKDGDLEATRGNVVMEFGGKPVGDPLAFEQLLDDPEDPGIQFRIRRDDWGSDPVSYAKCRVELTKQHVQSAYQNEDHRLRIVPQGKADGENEIEVSECTDGWFGELGLRYLDIGVDAAEQTETYDEPARPELSGYEAGELRMLPPETSESEQSKPVASAE